MGLFDGLKDKLKATFALLGEIKYLPDLITIINLGKKAKDDNVPGFTLAQYDELLDTAFVHLPVKVKKTAEQSELLATLVSGQALYLACKKVVETEGKAFVGHVKSLFV
jgi:hypothetical protein